jgi:hypothetical protein
VAKFRVIGPYFFEHEDERAVTVISACYVEMLRFLMPSSKEKTSRKQTASRVTPPNKSQKCYHLRQLAQAITVKLDC